LLLTELIFLGFVFDGFLQWYYEEELLSTRLERKESLQKAITVEGVLDCLQIAIESIFSNQIVKGVS
jgi:hypothetical protein